MQKASHKGAKYTLFLRLILAILGRGNIIIPRFNGELALIQSFVKRGDVVMDIGANAGIYTLYLSRLVGNQGLVMAYEPNASVLRSLAIVSRMTRATNVRLINKACCYCR